MHALQSRQPRGREISDIVAYLKLHHAALLAAQDSGAQTGEDFARRHAKVMDGLLTTLFPLAIASLPPEARRRPVLLAAVGGYGRGLLAWKSDLDVRLVGLD